MAALTGIKGIGKAALELLEAAGMRDAEQLAAQDIDTLVAELRRANEVLSICKRPPTKAAVTKWISSAKGLAESEPRDEPSPEPADPAPVASAPDPDLAVLLSRSPCAIPLPGGVMVEKGIAVSDVPAALPLGSFRGDRLPPADIDATPGAEIPVRLITGNPGTGGKAPGKRPFDAPLGKPMATEPADGRRLPKSKPPGERDRVSLIRAPLEATNRGINPKSRRYVRGVLHTDPWGVRTGAVFSLLLMANLPLAIIAAVLILLSRELPGTFPWVPEWFLAFPLALPLTGLGYLAWGFPSKCRICTQRLFVHKAALKHVKSHRIPGMGYVAPLCIHLLLFGWFRCSSCGTPVRLKM